MVAGQPARPLACCRTSAAAATTGYHRRLYVVTGSPSAVTTAIDGTAAYAGDAGFERLFVASTAFTVSVVGPDSGGSHAAQNAVVASVQQVLGLASVPVGNIAISSLARWHQPHGADQRPHQRGSGDQPDDRRHLHVCPQAYQAEFLGGSTNATLQDTDVGDAVLVGNTGNDVLIAGAANDSIVAGNGNNTLKGGSGTVALDAGNAQRRSDHHVGRSRPGRHGLAGRRKQRHGATPAAPAPPTGGNGNIDLIDASGSGPSASDTIVSGGLRSSVLGGAGSLTVLDQGAHDTIHGGSGTTSVLASSDGSFIYGGQGTLTVDATGSAETIVAAAGAAAITASGSGNVFAAGSGGTSIVASGSADLIYGGVGTLNIDASGSTNLTVGGGSAAETINGGTATNSPRIQREQRRQRSCSAE